MARRNAMEETYEEVELFGKTVLFTPIRLARNTVPEGLHLYEIRHADENGGDPVQLGQGILVNHFGTILSREPIELGEDGFRDIGQEDFSYKDSGTINLKDFLEGVPPLKAQAQKLTKEDFPLCFSDDTNDRKFGCIGHLRGDFGNGKEFWHTWWDHRAELNAQPFKSEFSKVVANLRKGPLQSLEALRTYCRGNSQAKLPSEYRDNEYLLKLSTERFDYYVRLNPQKDDYNFYIYCYDRESRYISLPEMCYSTVPTTGELIIIKNGEKGYCPCTLSTDDREKNRNTADLENTKQGIGKRQEEAMLAGSMFGWDVSAANPQVQTQMRKKRSEPER